MRLTSVPIIINRLLAPTLPQLLDGNPHLQLELIADQNDYSLTRREADMAIRLARPRYGGHKVKTRLIGELHYFAYRAVGADDIASNRWIAYDDTSAHLPQARWIEAQAGANRNRPVSIRVNDNEAAYQAVLAGQGMFTVAVRDSRSRPPPGPRR